MLRFALLVLLLANAVYLAWSQGWMDTLGWAPQEQSEPYRLQQQVRPDALSLVTTSPPDAPPVAAPQPVPSTVAALPSWPQTAATADDIHTAALGLPWQPAAPEEVPLCLQSDPMSEAQHQQLLQALRSSALPADSWDFVTTPTAGRWMVYLGKFSSDAALEKRRAELRSRKIGYDRAGGHLEPGLSLGRFSTEEAATRELGNMVKQGIRGARVVQERAAHTLYALRLSHSTAAQRALLPSLQTAMSGKAMHPCP